MRFDRGLRGGAVDILQLVLFSIVVATVGLPLRGQQSELRSLASGLADDIAASGRKSIAVVDFTDLQGNPTELGRFLAEEFSIALTRTHKGFEVIDRGHLKAILIEHKLAATGLIDPATAKRLGQIVGADILVTGSMTPFSESVRVAVKALATDTARIVAADTTDLPKTATITELIGRGIGGKDSPPGTGPPPRSAVDAGSRPAPPPGSPVVMAEGYQYEVVSCNGIANSVRCKLRITNHMADRWLSFGCFKNPYLVGSAGTRAYDNFGNESQGEACSLSNRGGGGSMTLVSGVTVEASVMFQTLSPSATSLSLVNLFLSTGPTGKGFDVSFRGVPITR